MLPNGDPGTLDLLMLKVLQRGEAHGWGIMERIRTTSDDQLQVNQGSLYPSLIMLTVGITACLVPARRALKVQPTEALSSAQ